MKTHFLPQFLLKGFVNDGLFQLDTTTGECKRRSVEGAGHRTNLYPPELEQGLMKAIDKDASEIFDARIRGRREHIELSGTERTRLAEWLGLFGIRVPYTLENFKGHHAEFMSDPQNTVDLMYENAGKFLDLIEQRSPDSFREMMETFGEVAGREVILATFAAYLRERHGSAVPEPHALFVNHINEERMKRYAAILLSFQWFWFRSSTGFLIGDNPLCRWDRYAGRHNYGIGLSDVEVTFPLTKDLCLKMVPPRVRYRGEVLEAGGSLTREYNHRQLRSCVSRLYGQPHQINKLSEKLKRRSYEPRPSTMK